MFGIIQNLVEVYKPVSVKNLSYLNKIAFPGNTATKLPAYAAQAHLHFKATTADSLSGYCL